MASAAKVKRSHPSSTTSIKGAPACNNNNDKNKDIKRYNKDIKITRYKDTKIQRYKNKKIQRYKYTKIQRYKDTKMKDIKI